MSRQGWPTNSEEIYYLQCSNVLNQVRNICCTGNLRMGAGTFSKWGEQVRVKKTRKFLWFELATVHHKHWNMTSLTLSAYLSNFIQNLISPQRPLFTQHPIYHTLRWL